LIHLAFSIHGALAKNEDGCMNALLVNMKEFYRKLTETETPDGINNLFHALFVEINACIDKNIKTVNDKLVVFVREYIKQNYQNINLSLSQVADQVNISASYLGKIFKHSAQTAFSDCLKAYRLHKSCELLCETKKTINEISELCGLTNSSYFYSVFKKRYSVTPGIYRNRNQAQPG